ncbi:hypothetical protein HpMS120_02300 [Helicobacter pylori]
MSFTTPKNTESSLWKAPPIIAILSAFKLYFNEREFKNDPIPFTFLPISGLKKEPNEMKETIQKLHELDNDPIVLIDDDKKDGSDPQKVKSEQFKRANE